MRRLVCLTTMLFSSGAVAWALDAQGACAGLQQACPGVRFHHQFGRLTCVYGVAFGFGTSPHQTAEEFVQAHSDVFGVAPGDLVEGNRFNGLTSQPLMFDRDTGEHKFTLVYYTQCKDDIPVHRAELRLLMRNEPGHPLVLAASSLHDLGSFAVPAGATENLAENAARAAAVALHPDLVNFSPSEPVIWAGYDHISAPLTVALTFVGDNGLQATADYRKWRFVADAATGKILHQEDMILNVDVVGSVHGQATTIPKSAECNPEVDTVMPYARVNIGDTVAFADARGEFTIPNPGTGPVTVESGVRGKWFRVFNKGGANTILSLTVTPPGPANFMHNSANTSEFDRAEVNAYVQANLARDFALLQNPSYPGMQQGEFRVNVNLAQPCTAFYDYSSINFSRAGEGCANTAYSSVIHHEYGHHLVAMGGSGQGQYGAGMGDCIALLIADDPIFGYGFQGNCNTGLRNAANNLQYPCSGASHYCGQLLSGCVWSTRNELIVNYPSTYLDIISELTVNSILLHVGSMITPQITVDFLILDDDDGNLANGTPHYWEIANGFGAHNMPAPPFIKLGDMNCDGEVDFDDIDPFVLALSGQVAYQARYPNCRWLNADCNKDGKVDFDDIDPFVALIAG